MEQKPDCKVEKTHINNKDENPTNSLLQCSPLEKPKKEDHLPTPSAVPDQNSINIAVSEGFDGQNSSNIAVSEGFEGQNSTNIAVSEGFDGQPATAPAPAPAPSASSSMVLCGCKSCHLYVMIDQQDLRCPKCQSPLVKFFPE